MYYVIRVILFALIIILQTATRNHTEFFYCNCSVKNTKNCKPELEALRVI